MREMREREKREKRSGAEPSEETTIAAEAALDSQPLDRGGDDCAERQGKK
jgi:hypothetical protein